VLHVVAYAAAVCVCMPALPPDLCFVAAVLQLLCVIQDLWCPSDVCYDILGYPTLAGQYARHRSLPARGGAVVNMLLCLAAVACLQVICRVLSWKPYLLRVLFSWPGAIFLRAGALWASFLFTIHLLPQQPVS
jgi:hypothetical protein